MGKGDDALRIITSIVGSDNIKAKGNDMVCRAPYRNGDNDGAFSIQVTDGGNHVIWKDYVTGKGGGLLDLIAMMPSELFHLGAWNNGNGNAPDYSHVDMSEPPPELEDNAPPIAVVTAPPKSGAGAYAGRGDYAEKRGVTDEVFAEAGVTEVTISGVRWLSFHMDNDPNNPRMRRLDGGSPKWKPQYSAKQLGIEKIHPCLYKFKEALVIAGKMQLKHLVICNGQTSAIVAQSYWIPAFCISDGEGKPIPQPLIMQIQEALTKRGMSLWIAADNDDAGRKRGLSVHGEFWKFDPKIFEFTGEIEGYDLADHCAKHRAHSGDKLKDCQVNTPFNPQEHMMSDLQSTFNEMAKARRDNNTGKVAELIPRAQQIINDIREQTPSDDMIEDSLAETAKKRFNNLVVTRQENPGNVILGLETRIHALDLAMMGFHPGNAYVTVGENGSGKTQLMASFARALATQAPGVVISMETSPMTFTYRMAAVVTHIPYGHISNALVIEPDGNTHRPRQLAKLEVEQVNDELSDLGKAERYRHLMFARRGAKSPARLMDIAQDAVKRFGIQWMIIDSFNNVMSPGVTDEYVNMTQAAIMAETIAVDCGIAVFGTAQGGRNTKNRADKKLKNHDATGSGHVENKASALFAIYNPWLLVRRELMAESDVDLTNNPRHSASLLINKVRDGGTDGGSILCRYEGGCGFYDWPRPKRQG